MRTDYILHVRASEGLREGRRLTVDSDSPLRLERSGGAEQTLLREQPSTQQMLPELFLALNRLELRLQRVIICDIL